MLLEFRKRTFWAPLRRVICLTVALLLSFGAALAPLSEAIAADSRIKAAIIVDANTNNVL